MEVDWNWLRSACEIACAHPFDTAQLWAGFGGGSTPCHFDAKSNFFAQICGRKHVTLLSPSETYNIYPYPVKHPMDNFSMADLEDPDWERFPALRYARAMETTLSPGEVQSGAMPLVSTLSLQDDLHSGYFCTHTALSP